MAQMQVAPAPRANEDATPEPQQPKQHVRRVPARQGPTIEELLDQTHDALTMFQRAFAGYTSLVTAMHTYNKTLPEGDRPKGLPLLTFPATVNGRDTVDVVIDLKRLPTEHVNYVLPPLIYLQANDMIAAIQSLGKHAQMIEAMVIAAVPPQQQPPPPGAYQDEQAA